MATFPENKDAVPEIIKIPPIAISRIDLFVGAPLKNLETEETNEVDESNPYINKTTPATNKTIPRDLFIFSP